MYFLTCLNTYFLYIYIPNIDPTYTHRHLQMARYEEEKILLFENHLSSETNFQVITSSNSFLLNKLIIFAPRYNLRLDDAWITPGLTTSYYHHYIDPRTPLESSTTPLYYTHLVHHILYTLDNV